MSHFPMDELTSVFLSRGKDELKDLEASISYTPFGIDLQNLEESNDAESFRQQSLDDEPDSVKQWRREYHTNIEKKDANEAMRDKAMRDGAAKELAEWQTWHKKNLVEAHKQNLAHEEELQAQRDKTMLLSQSVSKVNSSDSAIWERVCQLCDLTVSTSSGDSVFLKSTVGASSNKDVTRFRSLLLSLKNNPPRVCH
ncbi:Clathrin light chain A [Taenia crassiceps]|uniref:Clathrin light chain n=1 Tax=Taenia crassiceps TaxID=6207 RepID=A0ABR4QA69_9CEST